MTATPERSDGLHKDLDFLIGPVAYNMPFKRAKGSTIADFDVVRIMFMRRCWPRRFIRH